MCHHLAAGHVSSYTSFVLPCLLYNRAKHDVKPVSHFSASWQFSLFLTPNCWECVDIVRRNHIWNLRELTKFCRCNSISFVLFVSSSILSYPSVTSRRNSKSGNVLVLLLLVFPRSLKETDSESDADWSVSRSLWGNLGVAQPLLAFEPSDPLSLSRLEDSALDGRLIFLTGVLFNGVSSGDADSVGLVPGLTSTGWRSIFGVLWGPFFLQSKKKMKEITDTCREQHGWVIVWRSQVQGLHPATCGICFLVVPSSDPWSRFVNSQLVCLLPDGIFNYVTFIWNICFLSLFQWHAYKLAKLSACIL